MTDSGKNHLWNGIDMSHAVEILHRAFIHPEHPTKDIFSNIQLRKLLLSAILSFFEIAKSQEYCQRVAAGSTSNRAFDFSPAVTHYINSQFTKVYRKSETQRTLSDYDKLQRAGLLTPYLKPLEEGWEENLTTGGGKLKKKKVPIYTIQLRSKKKGQMDPDQDGKDVKKKGKAKYTYTCIFPQFGEKNGTILSVEEAEKKQVFLNKEGNRAEIGIGSFMDTIQEIQLRKQLTILSSHVVSIKTRKRGRPRVRKVSQLEVAEENNKPGKSA